ncbi:CHAT domain-containing protein [Nocardia sp. NPDC050406]|uniref:CHAT domain-containing protein n=1 Tax=Nocardia sp. NPDC050406 TaxID=3364318 RepID=UPI0037A973F9
MTRESGDAADNRTALRRPASRPYNRNRTVYIRFGTKDDGYEVQAWGSAFPQDGGGGYQGKLQAKRNEIEDAVTVVRERWQRGVIDFKPEGRKGSGFPFTDRWDLSGSEDRELLDAVGLGLAQAGHELFHLLFENGDPGLAEIGEYLVYALRDGEQVITIESDHLFAPWPLLYVPMDASQRMYGVGSSWSMSGFLGYRHLVEHNLSRAKGFDSRIVFTSKPNIGLNVNEHVDREHPPTPFVEPVLKFFDDRTHAEVRRTRDELAVALLEQRATEHIIYFGCHGQVSSGELGRSYLELGDGEKIFSTELQSWLSKGHLRSQPVVFICACKGGRMAAHFYPAFGQHFLKYGARCLVGPQVDLPRAFALEYTTRLFTEFLDPGKRLGDVMRALTRTFADEYRNPLGLIFSLYRGIDVHLWKESP